MHAVIAGSSSSLREQVFALDAWAGGPYPSLNYTLFKYIAVQPLRDAEHLARYLSQTGMVLPANLTLLQLLSLSGGVGRVVLDVIRGDQSPCGRQHPVALFLSDPRFAMLAAYILTAPEITPDLGYWPPPLGLSEVEVLAFMRDIGFGHVAQRLLEQWCDCGVLFRTSEPPARIEFLFPYHARLLMLHLSSESQRQLSLARIQLHGISGSAGNALEDLCRPQLSALFAGAAQRGGTLCMRNKIAMMRDSSDRETLFDPRVHSQQVIRWASQLGLEDFALLPDSDSVPNGTMHVDAWQLKSPLVGTVMRAGNLGLALSAVITSKSLAPANDAVTYLSHASVKACWGFCALFAILTTAAVQSGSPGLTFLPRTVYLRTTAVLDMEAREAAAKPVVIEADLIAAFNASSKCAQIGSACPAAAAGTSFMWDVRDGLEWTETLLPRALRSDLRTPELMRREALVRSRLDPTLAGAIAPEPGVIAVQDGGRKRKRSVAIAALPAIDRTSTEPMHPSPVAFVGSASAALITEAAAASALPLPVGADWGLVALQANAALHSQVRAARDVPSLG